MDVNTILERLSVSGITLMVVGLIFCTQTSKLSRLIFKERRITFIMPMKVAGLLMAVLGALILLDFIPGL